MSKELLNRKEFADHIGRSERTVQYWKNKGFITNYTIDEINRLKDGENKFFTKGGYVKANNKNQKFTIFLKQQFEELFESDLKIQFEDAIKELFEVTNVDCKIKEVKITCDEEKYCLLACVENTFKLNNNGDVNLLCLCILWYDKYGFCYDSNLALVPFINFEEDEFNCLVKQIHNDFPNKLCDEIGWYKDLTIFPSLRCENCPEFSIKVNFDSAYIYLAMIIIFLGLCWDYSYIRLREFIYIDAYEDFMTIIDKKNIAIWNQFSVMKKLCWLDKFMKA